LLDDRLVLRKAALDQELRDAAQVRVAHLGEERNLPQRVDRFLAVLGDGHVDLDLGAPRRAACGATTVCYRTSFRRRALSAATIRLTSGLRSSFVTMSTSPASITPSPSTPSSATRRSPQTRLPPRSSKSSSPPTRRLCPGPTPSSDASDDQVPTSLQRNAT